jgi:hypothetical protein
MPKAILFLLACGLIAGCSPPKPATVKGSLANEGKPFALPSNTGDVAVSLFGLDAEGKIDVFKKYTGLVRSDGSFEIASSGGELPVGTYQWVIECTPGKVKEFEPFTLEKSKAKIELKPGPNQVVLDLSQK